jgi:beta-1,2-mannobiose phosphorylase / 1,2-beta-oligomannan phosphorylase
MSLQLERMGVILAPKGEAPFTEAKYNAGMALGDGVVHMVYRYSVWRSWFDPRRQCNYAVNQSRYARLTPEGRLREDTERIVLAPSEAREVSGCEDARVVRFEGWYYLTYTAWDKDLAAAGGGKPRVGVARTRDFAVVERLGIIDHYTWDKDAFIFPERIGGRIAFVHRVEPNVQIDYFGSFDELVDPRSWKGYRKRVNDSTILRAAFEWESGKVGGSVPPLRTRDGWLMIYHAVQPAADRRNGFIYRAGAALLDGENPTRVIARLPTPILEPRESYELYGDVDSVVFPAGGYIHQDTLYVSYGCADRCTAMARVGVEDLLSELRRHPVK